MTKTLRDTNGKLLPVTFWVLIDRASGDVIAQDYSEHKMRVKCETINNRKNREATYVRSYDA